MKKNVLKCLIITAIVLVSYYIFLPALNFTDPEFYGFMVAMLAASVLVCNIIDVSSFHFNFKKFKNTSIFTLVILAFPVAIILINFFCSPLFSAKSYYKRIDVTNGEFSKDVELVDFNKLALLDKNSSRKLGDKVMGQMPNLVSQFEVSPLYTQINYNGNLLRVTPLEYSNFIKYLTNRKEGIKGFITVNSISGETKLSQLDKGMKIMPSAYFFENLDRVLRFKYPTTIFGNKSFELDESGNPYWVIETIKYTGIGLKKEASGVIVLDPITGKSTKYKVNEVPKWVDRVYSPYLILDQLNSWGKYKNGFFNSVFGQKDVITPTAGYNYLLMNDDIYMYTGITSVLADEANIGFVLTNLRTKETKFYNEAGTNEISAMDSAEGQVQQMKYTSTFPLLINLDNKPTYLVSLKDKAGLVKMYAFVDYVDYQKVVVTDAAKGIVKAAENYLGGKVIDDDIVTKEIVVDDITTGVIDGNTYYYLKDNDDVFKAILSKNENILPFVKIGDKLIVSYKLGDINYVVKIEK